MNWLQQIVNRVRPAKPDNMRVMFIGRGQSGVYVDHDTALRYNAVWACVNVVAKAIAILPWCVYERTKVGRREIDYSGSNVAWLLHNQPNPEMGPYQFKHALVCHVLTWGNAYCEIQRDGMGRPVWLWPITPDRVTVQRDPEDKVVYRVTNRGAEDSILPAADVFHLRGMGFDGLLGYSVIRMAAESIGLGIAMEQFGSSFFGNGAQVGGVLEHPKQLSDEARKNITESMQRRFGGKNALGLFVAEEGMKYNRIGVPPEDAQFLDSRKIAVLDICRWYGVPPHKVASMDRATYNNIEHQEIEFVTDTIQPWVTQFEEEANLKLFGRQQRGVLYTKFNLAALLRGDMKTRYEAYKIAHDNGWLNGDEIREFEELNPIPKGLGKMYVVPSNMTTRERMKTGEVQPGQTTSPDPLPDAEDAMRGALKGIKDQRVLNAARKR